MKVSSLWTGEARNYEARTAVEIQTDRGRGGSTYDQRGGEIVKQQADDRRTQSVRQEISIHTCQGSTIVHIRATVTCLSGSVIAEASSILLFEVTLQARVIQQLSTTTTCMQR